MNEIIAALLLITFCLFIWRFVKSINITVNVSAKVSLPKVEILPAPIQLINPENGDGVFFSPEGDPLSKEEVIDPMDRVAEIFHGIREDMDV